MGHDQHDAGYAALASGAHARALAIFDQLLEQTPDDARARYGRAQTLFVMAHDREAMQDARTLLEVAPGDAAAHALHARIAWTLGLLQPSQASYERAIELSEGDDGIRLEYADFLARERGVRIAEEVAEACVRDLPDAPEAWLALGRIRLRQHRHAEAKAAFERALELDPNHSGAQVAMIGLLSLTGRDGEAAALTDLLGDDPAAAAFVESQRRYLKERAQTRTLIEREEVREEVMGRSLGERWYQRSRVVWSVVLLGAVLVTLVLMLASGNPFVLVSTGGLLLTFALWRYATAS